MPKNSVVLAALLLIAVLVYVADVFLTPETILPAAAYAVPIFLGAWALPPRHVAAISIFSGLLEIAAALAHPQLPLWLFAIYIVGIVFFGVLGTGLSARIQRERALATRARSAANEIARLYQELQAQHEELQSQTEELHVQAEELAAQAEELHQQNEGLRVRDAELRRLADEKATAAALANRKATELRSVLDNMVDAVYVTDAEGRIALANRAVFDLVGMDESEVIGLHAVELSRRIDATARDGSPRAPEDQPLARALTGQTVILDDWIVHNRRTGRTHHVRSNASPLRDADGKVVGAVAVSRDVTELAALETLKDQLIGVAAHELKTPVTVMKGYAQLLLRRGDPLPPDRRKILESIDHGADRIDSIVQGLLEVSLLSTGGLRISPESVDLAALVQRQVARAVAANPTHEFHLVKVEPLEAHADRLRLRQVLDILLDNAVRYSPAGGLVEVALSCEGDLAVITVRDNGIGIPADKQAGIFQRLYRAHTDTPYDRGGLGLGLYLSREIVRLHGGDMDFQSAEGAGSTFRFTLPLDQAMGNE